MKKEQQQHIIEKQVININIDGSMDRATLNTLHDRIIKLYKTKIGEELDKIFSELVPPNVHVQLDKLNINLPKVDVRSLEDLDDVEKIINKHFGAQARKEIREQVIKASGGKLEKNRSGKVEVSLWAILRYFLENGYYPSWASARNYSIDKIFEELMRKDAKRVAKLVLDLLRKDKKVLDRIIFQFRTKYIERLLQILLQKFGRAAIKQIQLIRRRLGKRYKTMRGQRSINKAILTAAFEYLMDNIDSGNKIKYKERDFIQHIVQHIQSKYRHVAEEDIVYRSDSVKTEHSSQYSDLDALEYFLRYGSIPYWAHADSRSSMQELLQRLSNKRLIGLQRMISRNLDDAAFVQRLTMQFSSEQIFELLEPLADDHLRFMQGMLGEFQRLAKALTGLSAGQSQLAVKEAAIQHIIGQRGRFSKIDLTRLALQKASQYARAPFDETQEQFYLQMQQAAATSYDLSRSELLRIMNEINPELVGELEKKVDERRAAEREEEGLRKRLAELREQAQQEDLSAIDLASLKNERRQLRKQLRQLEDRMLRLGIAPSDSIRGLAERKQALERQLSNLQLQLRQREELHEDEVEDLRNERKKIRQDLNKIGKDFDKLQSQLLKDFDKAASQQQRLKLKDEFDSALALLIKDQKRLQNRLNEIALALKEKLSKKDRRKLKRRQKTIEDELKNIEKKLEEVEEVAAKIKTEIESLDAMEAPEEATATSKLDFLMFFLQYASVPWWAEEYKDNSVESIIKEFAQSDPGKLKQAFARVGRNPGVWQRLVNQLKEDTLEDVLLVIFPNFAGFAISTAIMLERIKDSQILASLKSVSGMAFKWTKVVETLFSTPSGLNPSDFVKEVALRTGRQFNVSPSQLLEYMTNLSNNNPGTRLSIFADVIAPIAEDESFLEAEKAMLEEAFYQQQLQEGKIIPDDKKYSTLEEYLLKGKFTDEAVKAGYGSVKAMEQLLLELMTKQPTSSEKLLLDSMKSHDGRRRLLDFQVSTYWDVVLITGTRTMPLAFRFIGDLSRALGDDNMFIARDSLLRFISNMGNQPFVGRNFMDQLLDQAVRATKRKRIAIIDEWKRKLYALGNLQSSLILVLMQLEMQIFKSEKEASDDKSEQEQLQDRMNSLSSEFRQVNQRMVYLLNRENAESQGLEDVPDSAEELKKEIEKLEKELQELRDSIPENPTPQQLMEQIMQQRQMAQLEGKLNLLKMHEPLLERKKAKKPKQEEPKEERKKPLEKTVDEPLLVKNAGLVILWPYFSRLFNALNLLEANKFEDLDNQIKAAHLLQYIVNGQTEHPENEMVLNKIICGIPLETPIPLDVGLTEDELKTADSLLQGAITNWPRMKTMSPDALRGTFLVREGSIVEEADRWKLKVEKGSFDVLLKTIPWGYTFVRLGWMPKFIMVEWELPG